jgi:hypothetical protein
MEMDRPQVEAYFDIIETLQARLLFLKQHKREVNLLDKALHTDENYPIRPSWKRVYYDTSILFDRVFEAAYRLR